MKVAMKLYFIELNAKEIIIDGQKYKNGIMHGYVQRKKPLEIDYKSLLSQRAYHYLLRQQKSGYTSEESLYVQELLTRDETELAKPVLQDLGSGKFIGVLTPIEDKYPWSGLHQMHQKETFSTTIKLNENLILVLFGYVADFST